MDKVSFVSTCRRIVWMFTSCRRAKPSLSNAMVVGSLFAGGAAEAHFFPSLVVVEATGGFELTPTAAALAGAGLPLAVVNPAQIRHYAQALESARRPIPIDAQVIARFAAESIRPEARPLPDE